MDSKLSDKLKACVGNYFRYRKQCILLAFEAFSTDIMAMTEAGTLYEVEVKTSLSDLYRDLKSKASKHQNFRQGYVSRSQWRCVPHYFYFAVPVPIANKCCLICDSKYGYAGVIGVPDGNSPNVIIYRKARKLNGVKLIQDQINEIMKQQSGTLCRMAMLLAGVDYKASG